MTSQELKWYLETHFKSWVFHGVRHDGASHTNIESQGLQWTLGALEVMKEVTLRRAMKEAGLEEKKPPLCEKCNHGLFCLECGAAQQ